MQKNNYLQKLILAGISLILIAIPFMWTPLNFYGGDDSRLYYMYPMEYFRNFTLSIISENMLGSLGSYFPQSYIIPFIFLIVLVKNIFFFLDTQLFMYGCVLAGGFISFYALLGLWIPNSKKTFFFIKIISAFMYIFSIFSSYTVWGYQLFSLYLIAVYPLCLYLFISGIQNRSYIRIILLGLLTGIWSIVILSTPWLIALIIVSLPLILVVAYEHPRSFLKMTSILLCISIILNIHWIFHLLNSIFNSHGPGSITSSVLSGEMRSSNENVIRGVGGTNNVFYPMFNLFHKNIQIQFGWPVYKIFSEWYIKFLPLNSLFTGIILVSCLFRDQLTRSKKTSNIYLVHTAVLIGWLLCLYLYTARVGPWGLDFFVFLNKTVPGFVMFRNMFDKFSLSLSFSFAFTFAIAAYIVFRRQTYTVLTQTILVVCLLIAIISAKPFISGQLYSFPFGNSTHTYLTIDSLNQDYLDLVDYLKSHPSSGRSIWLPLSNANYTILSDSKIPQHYYIGVSPLHILSQQSDLTGTFSFTDHDSRSLQGYIKSKDVDAIGMLFRKYGIDRIILNKDIPKDVQESSLFDKASIILLEQGSFQKLVNIKKASFGSRYEIYDIKSEYLLPRVHIIDISNPDELIPIVSNRISSNEYQISLPAQSISKNLRLRFLDPYHSQWRLYSQSSSIFERPTSLFGYAMEFKIPSQSQRTGVITLHLYFEPARYMRILYSISIVGYIGCLFALLLLTIQHYREKKQE